MSDCCQTIVDLGNCYHLLIMSVGKKANLNGKLVSYSSLSFLSYVS